MSSLEIPIFPELPEIEEEGDVIIKPAGEIARRVVILSYLNCLASGMSSKEEIESFLNRTSLWDKMSSTEKEFFKKEELTDDDINIITWRAESIWMLLWVLQKIKTMDFPVNEIPPQEIFPHLPSFLADPDEFIGSATTRPASEILDYSDLIFRLFWALQHPKEKALPIPLNISVAYERYNAIFWAASARQWDDT